MILHAFKTFYIDVEKKPNTSSLNGRKPTCATSCDFLFVRCYQILLLYFYIEQWQTYDFSRGSR